MMEPTLHPMPRWRGVVLEQIRVVGLTLRPVWLVVAVVLGIGTLVIAAEILDGDPGFDSVEMLPTAFIGFLFPFAVWRGERRFGPSFLWTLPVDRRPLALARVFAGFVWWMAALAVFVVWLLALGLLGGAPAAHTIARIPYIASIGAYLFGSAVVVGLRHPLRWLFGTAGLFFLLGGVSQQLERFYGVQTLLGSNSLYVATEAALVRWRALSDPAQWILTTSLALGAGFIALWAAASRHRERRRQ
jgi:hypothetical protein